MYPVPSDNRTTSERTAGEALTYTLGADLIDAGGIRSRFWFRRPEDRAEFVRLFNSLQERWGHRTRAEIIE